MEYREFRENSDHCTYRLKIQISLLMRAPRILYPFLYKFIFFIVIDINDILGLQFARVDEPLSHFQRLLVPKFKVIPQPFNRGLTYAAELYSFLPSSLKIFSVVLTAKLSF